MKKTKMDKLDEFFKRPSVYGLGFCLVIITMILQITIGFNQELCMALSSDNQILIASNIFYQDQVFLLRKEIKDIREHIILNNPILFTTSDIDFKTLKY